MQTKQQRQQAALNRLLSQVTKLWDQRNSLQSQSYSLIAPCDNELRLAQEVNRLRYNLGLSCQLSPCPF